MYAHAHISRRRVTINFDSQVHVPFAASASLSFTVSPFSIPVHPCASKDRCSRCIHAFFADGQRSSLCCWSFQPLKPIAGGAPVAVTDHRAPQSPPKIAELLGIAVNNIRTYPVIPPARTLFVRSQEETVSPSRARVIQESIPLKTCLNFSFLFASISVIFLHITLG